jgi:hypothetical protein
VKVYDREPAEILIRGCATAEHAWQVRSRASLDPLDDLHVWSSEQLDKRWNNKPHQPHLLVAVRVYRLAGPRTIANNPRYAGCKSWVELDAADAIDDSKTTAALDDAAFQAIVSRIDAALC